MNDDWFIELVLTLIVAGVIAFIYWTYESGCHEKGGVVVEGALTYQCVKGELMP